MSRPFEKLTEILSKKHQTKANEGNGSIFSPKGVFSLLNKGTTSPVNFTGGKKINSPIKNNVCNCTNFNEVKHSPITSVPSGRAKLPKVKEAATTSLQREQDLFCQDSTILDQGNSVQIAEEGKTQLKPVKEVSLKVLLAEWGLPQIIAGFYMKKGVDILYDWQARILRGPAKEGGNILFSLPTSSGKSLVAEMCLLRSVLTHRKKGFFVLPFQSVVQEKVEALTPLFARIGVCLDPYYSGFGPVPTPSGPQLIIGTPEKITLAINDLLQTGRAEEIGCFVVDEVHMVGEPGRGAVIENLVSKMLFVGERKFQICGISATIGNISDIGRWMRADVTVETFRPIPLTEHVVANGKVYGKNKEYERDISVATKLEFTKRDSKIYGMVVV
jgi:superfamily II helicase